MFKNLINAYTGKAFFTIVAFMLHQFTYSSTYYVSPSGNDAAKGTVQQPWATIQKACDVLVAGDTAIIRDGVYYTNKIIRLKNSGTKDKWITLMVLPNEKAVIDADSLKYIDEWEKKDTAYMKRMQKRGLDVNKLTISSRTVGAFQIEGVSYIRVIGLAVKMSHAAGIVVKGPSKKIDLIGCKTDNTFNSGIGVWYADSVRVLNCEVVRANNKELTHNFPVRVEAPHEAISLAGARYFEVAYNHVHLCFKEGIDCKEVSAHGIIHHNYIHNMLRQGLYIDCWFGILKNIEAYGNVIHDCDIAGIAVSGEGKEANMENIHLHHNLVFNNYGSGILFGPWGYNRMRKNIEIAFNTVVNNGGPGHWMGENGGIDIRTDSLLNLNIHHNVVDGNWGFQLALPVKSNNASTFLTKNKITINDNLLGEYKSKVTPRMVSHFVHVYGYQADSDKNIANNPFADVKNKNYRLQSEALNSKYGAYSGENQAFFPVKIHFFNP